MKKRLLVSGLWFFAGWCVGSLLAFALAVSALLGPILGIGAAAVVFIDPYNLLWAPSETRTRSQARLAATSLPALDADRLS
jgi:hypothetical protein